MENEIAYDLTGRYNAFSKTIHKEGFVIPNNHLVLTNRLNYSSSVAFVISGENKIYLIIPNDSDKESQQTQSERKRLKELADKFKE